MYTHSSMDLSWVLTEGIVEYYWYYWTHFNLHTSNDNAQIYVYLLCSGFIQSSVGCIRSCDRWPDIPASLFSFLNSGLSSLQNPQVSHGSLRPLWQTCLICRERSSTAIAVLYGSSSLTHTAGWIRVEFIHRYKCKARGELSLVEASKDSSGFIMNACQQLNRRDPTQNCADCETDEGICSFVIRPMTWKSGIDVDQWLPRSWLRSHKSTLPRIDLESAN